MNLDLEYSPSSCAPDFRAILGRYRELSDRAHTELTCTRNIRYGPGTAEFLDFFPSARPGAPLHVFVHGGHWQESSKEDSAFAAPGFVRAGAAFAAIGYGLAPAHDLPSMVASVHRALNWLRHNASRMGVGELHVSGSSAGAHLVATVLASTEVASACLLSGVYDLEPVRHTYVNDALRLDAATAAAYSPVHRPAPRTPVILARGEHETSEYARQHTGYADVLRASGMRPADLVVAGRNHFDLPFDLADPATELGSAVLAAMGLQQAMR